MRSEELLSMVCDAEDAGKDVYVQRHEFSDVIEFVEIDGVEYYNDEYRDELEDAYWVEDAYRVAERSMY